MRIPHQKNLIGVSSLVLLMSLWGCGGGGGGGTDSAAAPEPLSLAYDGNTLSALITTTNAAELIADLTGSNESATLIGVSASVASGDDAALPGSGAAGTAIRLDRSLRGAVFPQGRLSTGQQRTAMPIDSTEQCDSGSVHTAGTLSDAGTGTLTVTYSACRMGADTISGQATMRVDAFDTTNLAPTDMTFGFSTLTLQGQGLDAEIAGTLRSQIDIAGDTATLTENVVTLDKLSGVKTKSENMVIAIVYDDVMMPSSYTANVSGRLFDSVHGYVDVSTAIPLVYSTMSQFFPDSGEIVLAGAENRRVRATALSGTLARLALDLDGNGIAETTATLKWTDLSGPIGRDLGDNDGDGMHNSWESAWSMNPNDGADAMLDSDGDGARNLDEYMAGTAPLDAASMPMSGAMAAMVVN